MKSEVRGKKNFPRGLFRTFGMISGNLFQRDRYCTFQPLQFVRVPIVGSRFNMESLSHYDLACRWHGGQWSALYAFLSSGTVTHGLAREVKHCTMLATQWGEEIDALKDFLAWAEIEENKLLTSD